MDNGSEPLDPPTDFIDTFAGGAQYINFSYAIIVFCLFLFVSSNIFINQFLSGFSDTIKGGQLTVKAILIQAIVLTLLFICMQFIVSADLI